MLKFFRGFQKCKNMLNNFVPPLLPTSDFHPRHCALGTPRRQGLCSHCPPLGPQDNRGFVATLPTLVFSLCFHSLLPTLGLFEHRWLQSALFPYCLPRMGVVSTIKQTHTGYADPKPGCGLLPKGPTNRPASHRVEVNAMIVSRGFFTLTPKPRPPALAVAYPCLSKCLCLS